MDHHVAVLRQHSYTLAGPGVAGIGERALRYVDAVAEAVQVRLMLDGVLCRNCLAIALDLVAAAQFPHVRDGASARQGAAAGFKKGEAFWLTRARRQIEIEGAALRK